MEQGLLHLHNLMRWVVLLFGIITIFTSMGGMGGGKAFTTGNRKNALFLMISCDIQLLLGLALYFIGPWGLKNIQNMGGMGAAMKDPMSRFYGVEHILGMLVAIILIHIGVASVKKDIPDASKFKKLFWFTLIAFILIIATIPWPFREVGAGRAWFPGM